MYCCDSGLSRVCRLKLKSWFSIYWWRCPANRGATVNPCADVPWHQVQLRTGTESAAASAAPAEIRMPRNTMFNGLIMIRVLHHENSRHSTLSLQIADIGRDGGDLRLGEIVRGRYHNGRRVRCALTPLFAPVRQLLDGVGE